MKLKRNPYNDSSNQWKGFDDKSQNLLKEIDKRSINADFVKFIMCLLIFVWKDSRLIEHKVRTPDGLIKKSYRPAYNTPYSSGSILIDTDTAILVLAYYFKSLADSYCLNYITALFNYGNVEGKRWKETTIKQRLHRAKKNTNDIHGLLKYYVLIYLYIYHYKPMKEKGSPTDRFIESHIMSLRASRMIGEKITIDMEVHKRIIDEKYKKYKDFCSLINKNFYRRNEERLKEISEDIKTK